MYVTDKTMFCQSFPPVVCRREHVLFTSYVFVCSQWCPTHIDYMSNMTHVLLEAGTTCPSRADGFTTSYWWGTCCSSFQYSVLCFCFVCFRLFSCVPNVISFSGLSILHSPFGFFSNVYLSHTFASSTPRYGLDSNLKLQ